MTSTDELVPVLKKLSLGGVLQALPLRRQHAIDENLDHNDFLFRLLADELERRENKKLQDRLGRDNFEHGKTLEDFDFLFNIKSPRSTIIDLATCRFVERHEAVLLVGPTGGGKSHLAQAMGHRAVRRGMNVLFLGATSSSRSSAQGAATGPTTGASPGSRRSTSWSSMTSAFAASVATSRRLSPRAHPAALRARGLERHVQPGAGRVASDVGRPAARERGPGPPPAQRPCPADRGRVLPHGSS